MNREETAKVLKIISSVYPITVDDMTVAVWQSLLPEPYDMVIGAVKECLRTSHYAPKPADIIERMHEKAVKVLPAESAWEEVRKILRSMSNDYREAREEYELYPDYIKRMYSFQDLWDMAFSQSSESLHTYERPRFIKDYRAFNESTVKISLGNTSVAAIASAMQNGDGVRFLTEKERQNDR